MNDAPDNFDPLLKLLVLKRHEQPPPGYFDRLPGQILKRLEVGKDGQAASWMERLFAGSFFRPAMAYGFLGAFCLLAVVGVTITLTSQSEIPIVQPISTDGFSLVGVPPSGAGDPSASSLSLSLSPAAFGDGSSTNPAAGSESANALFDGLRLQTRAVPASSVNR